MRDPHGYLVRILRNQGFASWDQMVSYWADVNRRCPREKREELGKLQERVAREGIEGPVLAWRDDVAELLDGDLSES